MNTIISQWITRDPDPKTQQELKGLIDAGNEAELQARFSGRLEFGTAGLRGVVGAGPNRMNRLVIQETATGLGQYLLSQIEEADHRGVVIGYDGRLDSKQFAQDAAAALTAMGIKVYLTSKVAATPLVAFGVKQLGTAAGIVVTASHNPPEYNGFKVYWENGAQIIAPHDSGIAAEIDKAAVQPLHLMDLEQAEHQGLLAWLGDDFYQAYLDTQLANPLLQNHHQPEAVSIAYTAMHGVGADMAETMLNRVGFEHVYSVAAQREPDGTFPTVNFPNPEEAGAMDLVIAEAKKHNATLACANDPDADRFAVAVRDLHGEYKMLTGDQVGILFGHYLLNVASGSNENLVGTTIVSSSLLEKIAQAHQANFYQTLTGFKWLTNVAMQKQTDTSQFLFAYEEALGYTVGSKVWDKDGLTALVAFAQMTAELAAKGQSIWSQLESIYRQHGFYLNAQRSIALMPDSPAIGSILRASPPARIAGIDIVQTDDLQTAQRTFSGSLATKPAESIDLPTSDVLIYHLENGARVVVRPSGTEPKVKCYYEVVEQMLEDESYEEAKQRAEAQMAALISEHQASL
ncbi:phosphoglucomutase [Photobacterium swingsii]|uniref:Phospho-sugar mutase n=1 Tax=Photobacterium swingsii TaxID=680026 RepID=A0A0J8VFG4_9GAMM|nr:phospho-sugar mutase [Photobacterium swingsii]KMV31852.1 phosphoglucomutase [Photobacterium swingsii]PSW25485.1 phospho-sugar mutase [Photobacterium swingsii]